MLRYRADGGQRLTGFVKLKQGRTVDAVESVLSGSLHAKARRSSRKRASNSGAPATRAREPEIPWKHPVGEVGFSKEYKSPSKNAQLVICKRLKIDEIVLSH